MCEAPVVEETKEKQNATLNNALQLFEELTKETKTLYEEKTSLLDIEGKLMLQINEEIERGRQRKEQLKAEVEELRKKCEELVAFLNSRRPESAS
jgi:predicted transcriptional regulator